MLTLALGAHSLVDMTSKGQSGSNVSCCNHVSLNCKASGMVSQRPRSLSVYSSILPTFIIPSLLRICRAKMVKWSTNSLSRSIVGFVVSGSGGWQSPMPEMPSGRPSVTEYCWSMCSIHHHSVRRIMLSRSCGADSRTFGSRWRPMECASRIVVPNSVQASRNLPLLVK